MKVQDRSQVTEREACLVYFISTKINSTTAAEVYVGLL